MISLDMIEWKKEIDGKGLVTRSRTPPKKRCAPLPFSDTSAHVTVFNIGRVVLADLPLIQLVSMRFRATVENIPIFFRECTIFRFFLSLHHLVGSGVVQAVEKLQKKCIIRFTEDEMHIICNDDANEGGIQVWSYVAPILSQPSA